MTDRDWVLVPVDPTPEQLVAGRKRLFADMTGAHMGPSAENTYRAMLAAAPQQPSAVNEALRNARDYIARNGFGHDQEERIAEIDAVLAPQQEGADHE